MTLGLLTAEQEFIVIFVMYIVGFAMGYFTNKYERYNFRTKEDRS